MVNLLANINSSRVDTSTLTMVMYLNTTRKNNNLIISKHANTFSGLLKPLNSIEQFKMEQYHISRPSIDTNRRVTNKLDTLTFVTFFPIKTRFKSDLRNVKWFLKINSTWTNSYFLKVFLFKPMIYMYFWHEKEKLIIEIRGHDKFKKKNIEKDLGIYRVVEITCEISTGISLCTKKWHIILIKWYDVSEEKHAKQKLVT